MNSTALYLAVLTGVLSVIGVKCACDNYPRKCKTYDSLGITTMLVFVCVWSINGIEHDPKLLLTYKCQNVFNFRE